MIKTRDMYEYIETMLSNTLIEVSKVRNLGLSGTNLLNNNMETGKVVRLVSTNWDHGALNGIYHEIDDMLVYDANTDLMMSTKRLRFDSSSFFDELTNNNIRGLGIPASPNPEPRYQLPRGYIKRITSSEQTVVSYLCPWGQFQDYEGDEIYLSSAIGKLYDFTIETLPIPAGNYEVRFGYGANGNRGVAQLYLDGVPAGVPLNLMISASNPQIGYVQPTQGDPGYENDKMMRNRGYMKAPAIFTAPQTGFFAKTENARYEAQALRRIMGIYKFKTAGTHFLGVKGLSAGEFMFDYMEFVPTSALEAEDIY